MVNIFLDMIFLQAFVSEYAVWKTDAGRGTLLASLAEAAFLTGLEKNRWHISSNILRPRLVHPENQKVFKIPCHIKSCDTCMKH